MCIRDRAEGDSADYWIVDETGELMQKYDDMTKGVKNGKPVYVEDVYKRQEHLIVELYSK